MEQVAVEPEIKGEVKPDLMSNVRQHKNVLWITLTICLFMIAEVYVLPLKDSLETVKDYNLYRSGRRGKSIHYTMTTEVKTYDITSGLYNDIELNETVVLEKSMITGSLQYARLEREEYIYRYSTGYLRDRAGWFFVGIVILGVLAMFIFLKKIDSIEGRRNLTYGLFIASLLILFTHIDWNI